jgi:hypothetical protein
VEWCAAGAAPQHRSLGLATGTWPEDGHVEPWLEENVARRADPVEEVKVSGAAAKEHVLAIVHDEPVMGKGPSKAPEPSALFEECHARPRVGAGEGGGHASETPSDDDDVRRVGGVAIGVVT